MSIIHEDINLHDLEHKYIRNILENDIPEPPKLLVQMGDPMEDSYLRMNHKIATELYKRYIEIYRNKS
jgi:hypothetical protein